MVVQLTSGAPASPMSTTPSGRRALPDGGLLAEIRFGSTDWLPMFVAQHGGAARILQPEELAAASREWLCRCPGPI